ncbi:protein phosphatase inhibitor 2 [Cryptosporidium ryanae]|uniref:protein phosphatase inhibitor 2 n=1 Tax=Cryptosporidium ryanae TaxID=515981 RepID=UPI00351A36B9|nr:protein phosphatase inhibitor 2 [Cryptosporidium ryanae]
MRKGKNKDSREKRKGVTWDEDNIELHDAERGTRMKINEPDTPYCCYGSGNSSFSEDESQEPMINTGKIATPEDIRLKLVEYSSNLSKNGNGDVAIDNCDGYSYNSPKSTDEPCTFESKRKAHYNEFIIVKSSKELFNDDNCDEEEKMC